MGWEPDDLASLPERYRQQIADRIGGRQQRRIQAGRPADAGYDEILGAVGRPVAQQRRRQTAAQQPALAPLEHQVVDTPPDRLAVLIAGMIPLVNEIGGWHHSDSVKSTWGDTIADLCTLRRVEPRDPDRRWDLWIWNLRAPRPGPLPDSGGATIVAKGVLDGLSRGDRAVLAHDRNVAEHYPRPLRWTHDALVVLLTPGADYPLPAELAITI